MFVDVCSCLEMFSSSLFDMDCVYDVVWNKTHEIYILVEKRSISIFIIHLVFTFRSPCTRKGETREVKKACMRRHIDRCLMVIMDFFLLDVVSELKTARTFDPAPR